MVALVFLVVLVFLVFLLFLSSLFRGSPQLRWPRTGVIERQRREGAMAGQSGVEFNVRVREIRPILGGGWIFVVPLIPAGKPEHRFFAKFHRHVERCMLLDGCC